MEIKDLMCKCGDILIHTGSHSSGEIDLECYSCRADYCVLPKELNLFQKATGNVVSKKQDMFDVKPVSSIPVNRPSTPKTNELVSEIEDMLARLEAMK